MFPPKVSLSERLPAYLAEYNTKESEKNLNLEQNFTLGCIMYGDVLLREAVVQEAAAYAAIEAPVYLLYFDTDTKVELSVYCSF